MLVPTKRCNPGSLVGGGVTGVFQGQAGGHVDSGLVVPAVAGGLLHYVVDFEDLDDPDPTVLDVSFWR